MTSFSDARARPDAPDAERLRALVQTGLLDSAPEEPFDRLTGLAQRCLSVPIALVSLIDDDRQFFKSQQGLPEPWGSLRETPLSHSFCRQVVTSQQPLRVCDARTDARVRGNLAVPDLGVLAYLGVPLCTPDGYVIGALCVIDTVARSWTASDYDTLGTLAQAVMDEIAVRYRQGDVPPEASDASGMAPPQPAAPDSQPLKVVTTLDGDIVEGNQRARSFLGRTRSDLAGQRLWDLLPSAGVDGETLSGAVRAVREGGSVRFDGIALDPNGGCQPMTIRLAHIAGATDLVLFEGRPLAA